MQVLQGLARGECEVSAVGIEAARLVPYPIHIRVVQARWKFQEEYMRLRDLDASFVGFYDATNRSYKQVEDITDAQGVMFQCPKCAGNKPVEGQEGKRFVRGVHSILCWFRNPRVQLPVADDVAPAPGRWYIRPDSTSLDDLTFVGPGNLSVYLTGPGCGWHGFVSKGNAT